MKLPLYVFIIFFIGLFFTLQSLYSCKATKKSTTENMTMIILLEDNLQESYLLKAYADFNPTDIKRSNRTLNQYRTVFNCDKTAQTRLMKILDEDLKVIKATVADQKNIDIQSGGNDKKSRVKIN